MFNTFYILDLCSVGDQIQDILHIKHVKHLKIPVKYTPSFPNVMFPVLYSKTGTSSLLGTQSDTSSNEQTHNRQTVDKLETASYRQMEDMGREVEN